MKPLIAALIASLLAAFDCQESFALVAESVAPSPPAIAIAREPSRATITFTGVLESADTPSGPWKEAQNGGSSVMVDLEGVQKFFRAREADGSSIFSSRTVAELTVEGPLQHFFDMAFAGLPDGIFPPVREKPYFEGTVEISGSEIPVSLRVRGNSSLQECPFPKLKLKVSKADRPGTPFFDAREIKIGTHCGEGGRGNIGRLRDQRAAFREALAYETMELMGFVTPRVRRARIEYRDTTPTNAVVDSGWQVVRHALIFDDIEVVAERLAGRALDDEEVAALSEAGFDGQLIAELQLLNALLGNWDYELSTDGEGLWNVEVIELPDKRLTPVVGDFDLASFVTGEVRVSVPAEYHPELPDLERQALYDVEQVRQSAGEALFTAARDRFLLNREAIETQIHAAEIDDEGRANALEHASAFYDALAAVRK